MRATSQWPLLTQCTFRHVLVPIHPPAIPARNLAHCTRIQRSIPPLHGNSSLSASFLPAPSNPPRLCLSSFPRFLSTTSSSFKGSSPAHTPWTRSDDRMLSSLRKKATTLAEFQIYMPHQPIEVLESKLQELETKSATSISGVKKRPTFQRWTSEEDERLLKAVQELGSEGHWSEISDLYFLEGSSSGSQEGDGTVRKTTSRSPRSCQIRWKFLQPESGFRQGPWSAEELELFRELVQTVPQSSAESALSSDGEGDLPLILNDWDAISKAIGTRSPIQCHSQFKTVMHSGQKGKWTVNEINKLLEARELYGGDWQKVSKHVGTRAPGQVRQKWNQFSEDVLRRLEARRAKGAN